MGCAYSFVAFFKKNNRASILKIIRFNLVKTKPMIFDSFYVSLLSEEFKTGKKKFIKWLFYWHNIKYYWPIHKKRMF